MDDSDLSKLVDHRVHLGGVLFGLGLVGGVADVADSVSCRPCLIPVMQSVPFALAIGLFC